MVYDVGTSRKAPGATERAHLMTTLTTTPPTATAYRICTVGGDSRGYYHITNNQSYGPQATFARGGDGTYCRTHAHARAAELLPAWTARRVAVRQALPRYTTTTPMF